MTTINGKVDKAFAGKKTLMGDALESMVEQMVTSLKQEVTEQIQKQFYTIDFNGLVRDMISEKLDLLSHQMTFPDKSIPGSAVNLSDVTISGNQIDGGMIDEFASKGILDLAESTEMTIMENIVVIESNLVTRDLAVKGNAVVEGNLIVNGSIPIDSGAMESIISATSSRINKTMADSVTSTVIKSVTDKLQNESFDVNKLLFNGRDIFDNDDTLSPFIKNTKIRTVGELEELVVKGESQISGSLYTSHNRVGINTLDPSSALAVWDEEVEIIIGKHKSQTGYIGSVRTTDVILGANNKQNMVLGTNGETTIANLVIGQTEIGSASSIPTTGGKLGAIVFNSNPKHKDAWGWMHIGNGTWIVLGRIE